MRHILGAATLEAIAIPSTINSHRNNSIQYLYTYIELNPNATDLSDMEEKIVILEKM